ncbi:MAG: GTP-sensing pleiotropic transcriptional regulator CodY [Armatimonadota bacterium]|nr:GTP-sensing pleiotropic transcriptional regulator CodY [Armatimonadota bacterium]MDR5704016.1 GTP-sensing pleiotropic transcriptional regulator CodY [Armatimonadota bacterium]MDR7433681.1 GTP-sensing pleiotropic transcriptional regulator CodY [Armatimonadota bacterium]
MQGVQEKRERPRLLDVSPGGGVNLRTIAETLAQATSSAVLIVSPTGEILSQSPSGDLVREMWKEGRMLPSEVMEGLSAVSGVEVTTRAEFLRSLVPEKLWPLHALITPIQVGKERMGTLLLLRQGGEFEEKDCLLAEYAAVIVALAREGRGDAARSRDAVRIALGSLSFSEREAVAHVLSELPGQEGVVVASRVADRAGITRSVIVNALRKLESAQLIEARSLGMKGTYIKILNPQLTEELRSLSKIS